VVKASTLPATLRRLGEEDGLPALPAAEIMLHRAPGKPRRAATALADFIAASLRV
jgi:hypothetical protein